MKKSCLNKNKSEKKTPKYKPLDKKKFNPHNCNVIE